MLTLIKTTDWRTRDGHVVGKWQCSCGRVALIAVSRVKSGQTKSCGCLIGKAQKHGMRKSREYSCWQSMVRRCHSESDKDYARYGARGITVCDRWRTSFTNFFRDVGLRPAGCTLDRIDGRKGYAPGNVRWATASEQALNRKDITMIDSPIGRVPLVQYARHLGISKGAAHLRLRRGTLNGCTYA